MSSLMPLLRRWVLLSVLLACGCGVRAQEAARLLRLCADEAPLYPWRLAEPRRAGALPAGLDFVLIEQAAARMGLALELSLMPWRRCQAELQRGGQDAALGMSYRSDRMQFAVFPWRDLAPDEGLRMRRESYSLYALVQDGPVWDGRHLAAKGELVVGAPSGYSIVEQLQAMGLKVDEGTRSVEANLEKLVKRRVQALALPTGEGDEALKRDARWAQRVQRLDPPLVEKSYFLVYSHSYYGGNEAQAKRLWAELAQVRESAAFKRSEAELLRP